MTKVRQIMIVLPLILATATRSEAASASVFVELVNKCAMFLAPAPKAGWVGRLVRVKDLVVSNHGERQTLYANVIEQEGPNLTVEYIDPRLSILKTAQVTDKQIQRTWRLNDAYAKKLAQAEIDAKVPDRALQGRTIAWAGGEPALARIKLATRSTLEVEYIDEIDRQIIHQTIERPESIAPLAPNDRQIAVLDYYLELVQFLTRTPAFRDGAFLIWHLQGFSIAGGETKIEKSGFRGKKEVQTPIILRTNRNMAAPAGQRHADIQLTPTPVLVRDLVTAKTKRKLRIKIVKIEFRKNEGATIELQGEDWHEVLPLDADLLSESRFEPDPWGGFENLNTKGFEPFNEFRTKFKAQQLEVGAFLVVYPPSKDLRLPDVSGEPKAYRLIYADAARVILSNPEEDLELSSPSDLGRVATATLRPFVKGLDYYYRLHRSTEALLITGDFNPTADEIAKYPYLTYLPLIRRQLVQAGWSREQIDRVAELVWRKNVADPSYWLKLTKPRAGLSLETLTQAQLEQIRSAVRAFSEQVYPDHVAPSLTTPTKEFLKRAYAASIDYYYTLTPRLTNSGTSTEFIPNSRELAKYPYLRDLLVIAKELEANGFDSALIDRFTRAVFREESADPKFWMDEAMKQSRALSKEKYEAYCATLKPELANLFKEYMKRTHTDKMTVSISNSTRLYLSDVFTFVVKAYRKAK